MLVMLLNVGSMRTTLLQAEQRGNSRHREVWVPLPYPETDEVCSMIGQSERGGDHIIYDPNQDTQGNRHKPGLPSLDNF